MSWDYFFDKIVPPIIQGFTTIVALFLGARFTRQAAERAAAVQEELARKANKDRADLEEQARVVRDTRAHIERRLELQRGIYEDYYKLVAKWVNPDPMASLRNDSFAGQLDSDRAYREAHSEASAIHCRILLAFGSGEFADQACHFLVCAAAARGELMMTHVFSQAISEVQRSMIEVIEKTQDELALPRSKNLPRLIVPPKELNKVVADLKLEEMFDYAKRRGVNVEAVKKKIAEKREARAAQPSAAVGADGSPAVADRVATAGVPTDQGRSRVADVEKRVAEADGDEEESGDAASAVGREPR